MRTLTAHKIDERSEELIINAVDQPGVDGANHYYVISGFNTATNPSDPFTADYGKPAEHATLLFQNGTISENGLNGVTHEALLAIVVDRLKAFQEGPFPCRENALALDHAQQSLNWLKHRTYDRLRRKVGGELKS